MADFSTVANPTEDDFITLEGQSLFLHSLSCLSVWLLLLVVSCVVPKCEEMSLFYRH